MQSNLLAPAQPELYQLVCRSIFLRIIFWMKRDSKFSFVTNFNLILLKILVIQLAIPDWPHKALYSNQINLFS